MDWSKQIFEDDIKKKKEPEKKQDWSKDLFDVFPEGSKPVSASVGGQAEKPMLLKTGQEPTGMISTNTGKPITTNIGTGDKGAGFLTEVETGIVDDPQTKMNIYAKRRGIPVENYGIVDGEIVYKGDDGILHYETQPGLGKVKRFGANMISHAPEEIMATAMVPTGPGGVILGAAGGEAIRKIIGSLIYKEPQTTKGNIKDIAVSGATGYVGEKIGGGIIRGIDTSKGRQGAKLVEMAGRGRERIDRESVKRLEALGKKYGIQLYSPQTTGSPELISRFNLLGDLPITADKIGEAKMKQYAEIDRAIGTWLDTFSPPTTTPGEAGRRVVEASKEAIEAPKKAARKASEKYYDEALKERGVDISGTITQIDDLLNNAPKGGTEAKNLKRIKNMLMRKGKGEDGKEILIPEDRVSVINKVKKEMNSMWKKDPKNAPEIDAQKSINNVLDSMLTQVDEQVPSYKKARQSYKAEIDDKGLDELKKSKVGELSKIEGDKVEKVAQKVFSPSQSSPEIVSIAKESIIKHGGQEAWDALLRTHIKERFRDVVKTGTTNIGGMLRKKLFGDLGQREIIETAMTPVQYQNFSNLMDVFEAAGKTSGRESTTATRLVSLGEIEREAEGVTGKVVRAATRPLYTYQRIAGDFISRMRSDKYKEGMADLMLSEKASKQLQSMLRLEPGSQKQLRQLSTFLTIVSGGEARRGVERSTRKDVLPATLQKRQKIQGKGR